MAQLIVLFKLKDESSREAYEAWAQATDLPVVRALPSVDGFAVQRVSGLFGTDAPAPYDYVEVIDINSLEQFATDVGTETMAKVAGEFRTFADDPVFMLSDNLEGQR